MLLPTVTSWRFPWPSAQNDKAKDTTHGDAMPQCQGGSASRSIGLKACLG